jgi:hypothetical protein
MVHARNGGVYAMQCGDYYLVPDITGVVLVPIVGVCVIYARCIASCDGTTWNLIFFCLLH